MADHISQEAYINHLEEAGKLLELDLNNPFEDGVRIGLERAIMEADNFPAADVREVKKGKWSVHEIYKHEMSYGTTAYEPVYKCSACGNLMESYLRYDEPIMPEDADFPRYCPNCGADMREES